jgi:sulfur relay (sulfurtransferase) complex TusBCD TusD component (DsrE family)
MQMIARENGLLPNSKKSIFLGVMGTPFQSDLITSLFRLVHESLHQGHEVTVWCCGYATTLTQSTLQRQMDIFSELDGNNAKYPSTAELVREAVKASKGDLKWYICDYCMKERGAIHQIDEVYIKVPFSFYHYLDRADVSVVLGVKS